MGPRLETRTIGLRRVVITGMGSVSSVGNDVASAWSALLKGASGIARVEGFPVEGERVQIAGQLKGFDPRSVLERKEVRRLDPFVRYAVAAAQEAVDDAGLDMAREDAERVGVLVGSGIGGLHALEENCKVLQARGSGRVSPFFVPQLTANMASGYVSMRFGARGPNSCVVTACATGSHAIGEAYRLLQRGDADVMLAGGAEASVTPLGLAGFAAMRALSTRNDAPSRASRPFDAGRDGFVVAEGAGVLVMESLEHALVRGAPIHAELVGYGMSGDAHHMTAPPEDGMGAQIAMRRALQDARLEPGSVDYINAHGTSTPLNDSVETRAIRRVFAEHAERLMVSSTKSMTGHALGAAGGLEAIFTVLCVREGQVPPTINYEEPDPECDLDYVPNEARKADVKVALSNSFGFGGTNAVLAIARYDAEQEAP
ncbi:MAG: beta-ketoacyl-ACP synthase II [Deltaproteobacteria bacterium]|nr:beta-ketoacyl-ACP synthase II [Deltaproteobacteria bacterium]